MKKSNEDILGNVLNQMIDSYKLRPKLNAARIDAVWEQVMGKTIAGYTKNIRIRKNVLYLNITSAPLKRDLSFGREKIVERVNEALGEEYISDVIIG